jgi:hypothetical protein
MDSIIKAWLNELYDTAISETEALIGNERIWQKGADNDEEIRLREENIARDEEYIQVLKRLKDDVNRM